MRASDLVRDLLADGPFTRPEAPYRLLEVKGPDAVDFLQRLCSQDIAGMAPGDLRPAAFLDAKGKLLATCLAFRESESVWLETHVEQLERLAALLERYHFTEKLTITRFAGRCAEWVHALELTNRGGRPNGPYIALRRRGVSFVRAATEYSMDVDGVPAVPKPLESERAECLRLLAGFLRVGVETEPTTLALEADLDDHLSTTKGCYTGQEIVARIHTYGHTNRKACLLHLATGAPITAAQPLHEPEDKVAVGRVLHAVPIPGHDGRLGIGYLPKDFQALGTKLALADGTAVEVIGYEPLPGLPA
jgi:folate-binding protein YgfZ